jgi:hypothetical protein
MKTGDELGNCSSQLLARFLPHPREQEAKGHRPESFSRGAEGASFGQKNSGLAIAA